MSTWACYAANAWAFLSLAMVDEDAAQDGAVVTVLWPGSCHVEPIPRFITR
jgi:hypothetical protein